MTAKGGFRLALRIAGWAVGGLIALVVVAVAGLLVVGRSDWGHRQLLQMALPLAQKAILGELRIGALEGDLTHRLVLREVSLRDPEGHLVARLSRVGLRYNLLALIHRTVQLTAVDAQGEVHARYLRDGRLNFAALTKATPPSNQPLPIKVKVSGIAVDLTAYTHPPPPPVASPIPVLQVALHVEGGVQMSRDHSLEAELAELGAQVIAPAAVALHAQGRVELKGAGVVLRGVTLRARTTGAQINRLAPAADLRGTVDVTAQADGSLEQLQARLDVKLPAGDLHAEVKLRPQRDPLQWEGVLRARGVDPAALRAAVPSCTIDLDATAKGSGASGRLQLQALQVAAADNRVALGGWLEVPPGLVESRDWLGAKAELKLDVQVPHLDRLASMGAPRLGGALRGTAQARLDERSLRLTAALGGSRLRGPGAAVERLDLDVNTVDLSGKVTLLARDLLVAKQRFARLELAARGRREQLTLNVAGQGPEQVAFRLAADARPEFPHGTPATGALALLGLDAELTELLLSRQGKKLTLVQPARLRLDLHKAPVVDIEHFALALGGQRVMLNGHYETAGQRLRAQLQTRGLDARQLARLFDPRSDLPTTRVDVQATVHGTVAAPVGHMAVNALISPWPALQTPLSSVVATVDLRNQKVSGELALTPYSAASSRPQPSKPGGTDGRSEADGPRIQAQFSGPVSGRGSIHLDAAAQADLQSLQALLPPAARSLRGAVSVQLAADGTTARPELTVRAQLPAWQSAWGGGKNTALDIDYKGSRLSAQLATQLLTTDGQRIGGMKLDAQTPLVLGAGTSGAHILKQLQTGASTAELSLTALDIPKLWKTAMQEDAPLRGGTLEARLQLAGPLLDESTPPKATLRVGARDLSYAANSNSSQPPVKGQAELQLDYKDYKALLTLSGTLNGQPLLKGRADTKVRPKEVLSGGVKQLPIAAKVEILPQELPAGLPLRGQLSAQVQVSGTVGEPQGLVDITSQRLRLQDWAIGDINAHASADKHRGLKANVTVAAAPGQPGDIKIVALVPLPPSPQSPELRVELHAHGYRIDYKPPSQSSELLSTGGGAVRLARGLVDCDLQIRGGTPQLAGSGYLKLSGGELSAAALPQVFKDILVDLQVEPSGRFTLRKLSATAEGGKLTASGSAQLDGLFLQKVGLKANASHFPVAAGPIGLWLDTAIDLQAQTKGDTLSGKVKVAQTTVTLPKLESGRSVQALGPLEDVKIVDAAARRAAAAQVAAEAKKTAAKEKKAGKKSAGQAGGLPARTVIAVELPDPITVVGPEVKAQLMGNLNVEMNSTQKMPVITGEIHSLSGWVQLLKHHYQLSKARVSMSGETPPNPLLDVVISSQMQGATIYISVSGTAQKPRVNFRSDPPIYDQSQIIALVLSGGRQGGGGLQQKALGGLSSLLIDQLHERLGSGLPIDVIRFDLGSSDPMSSNRTSLEVGKYIRDDLFLMYTHRFGSSLNILHRSNNDEITLEWHFFRNYQLDLMGGDQGMGALDLYWLKRF